MIIRYIDVLSLYQARKETSRERRACFAVEAADPWQIHLMNSAFGAGLCLWTTAFLAARPSRPSLLSQGRLPTIHFRKRARIDFAKSDL